jgi:hypothetical protein
MRLDISLKRKKRTGRRREKPSIVVLTRNINDSNKNELKYILY